MRKTRFIENCRCYHLISRLAHQAFFLDDDEKSMREAMGEVLAEDSLVRMKGQNLLIHRH